MKANINKLRLIFFFCFLFLYYFSCFSQSYKLGVISDIHYLSEQLMDGGEELDKFTKASGRDLMSIPKVLDKVLDEYIAADIDILLVSGDMTNNGEKQSHLDIAAKFKRLTDNGIRVFVVPGNHDINIPKPVRFFQDKTLTVDNVSAEEFETIYSGCGFSSAIKRDTASLSYVSAIDEKVWLLAIDACLYKQHTDRGISAGQISPQTEQWLKSVLDEASRTNIRVIAMMHHGLVEHVMLQSVLYPDYLVKDWYRLSSFFADNGVEVIFTGHFHSNDISELVTPNNNKIYDVETGSLCSYPFSYRFVTLDANEMAITTKNVVSIPDDPQLADVSKERLKHLSQKGLLSIIRRKLPEISDSSAVQIAEIASDLFLLHLKGDEVVSDELKDKIIEIARQTDLVPDLSSDYLQFDFPPADGELKIRFSK